jgi:hypothetical protein
VGCLPSDRHALGLQAGEFALQAVDLEGQDPPGSVIIALTPRPPGLRARWTTSSGGRATRWCWRVCWTRGLIRWRFGWERRRGPRTAAYSPVHAYEFGLQVILDGFGALIGDRGRPEH